MANGFVLGKSDFQRFKKHLEKLGFKFEERPYQYFLARYPNFTINLYNSGKVTFGGKDDMLKREIEWFLQEIGAAVADEEKNLFSGRDRIGTDESGKGDLFGPIVIAGVFLRAEAEEALGEFDIKDSKKIRSEEKIRDITRNLKNSLKKEGFEIVVIGPAKYNLLYEKMQNMNRILGWGHARVIENLLAKNPDCRLAIADQFGDPAYIEKSLMKEGMKIDLIQMHRGEGDTAVAAASILAREKFLSAMANLSEEYGIEFPKGATKVKDALAEFVGTHGAEKLPNVAKMNFSTVQQRESR